jgi:hypothetical protein
MTAKKSEAALFLEGASYFSKPITGSPDMQVPLASLPPGLEISVVVERT